MKRLFERRWHLAFFRRVAPWIARLSSPCPEIARLASESCDRRLAWRERIRMWVHFVICDWCRRYTHQIGRLHRLAPSLVARAPRLRERPMPPEVRVRLKERLRWPRDPSEPPGPGSGPLSDL